MRTSLIVLAGLALSAAPLEGQRRPAPPANDILVGQVVDHAIGKTVNGWQHTLGSLYPKRVTRGFVTTETMECCVAVYKRGNRFIVARTKSVTERPDGQILTMRILSTYRVTAQPGEVEMNCDLAGQATFLTLRDPKTGWLRSVVLHADSFVTITWKDPGQFCYYGD